MSSFSLHPFTLYQRWQAQWERRSSGVFPLLIRLGSVLLLYVFLSRTFMAITELPFTDFEKPVIFIAFFQHLFTNVFGLLVGLLLLVLFYFRKAALVNWSEFSGNKYLRFYVLLPAGILAWVFATYDYNLYVQQAHYLDRIALLVLLFLIYSQPIFVLPFLLVLLPIIWQFEVLFGFSWAAPFLPIRVLILFSAFYLIRLFTKKMIIVDFVFLILCLIAAHYWYSGTGKLSWEWLRDDQIYLLLPATYANGWMAFLTPETMASITEILAIFNWPMKIFTLIVECGVLLLLWNKHSLRFFLIGWVLFHLGIFLVSGIFFWIWIVLEIGLLYLLFRQGKWANLPIFTKPHFIISILLILTGSFWCQPVRLSWYDVPLTYTYRFEAEMENGKTYPLPPRFFAPFDYQFTLGNFGHLSTEPILSATWGTTAFAKNMQEMLSLSSKEALLAHEANHGVLKKNAKRTATLKQFIKQFAQNWNERPSKKTWLSILHPPRLLWTFPNGVAFESTQQIQKVRVIQVLSFYQNEVYEEVRKREVLEVSVEE